jgi:hypothetical protein
VSRLERLALLGYFAVVVLLLASQALVPTVAGAAAGVVGGVAVAGRLGRLSQRMDAKLGTDPVVVASGLRLRRVITRVVVHLAVLFVLLIPTTIVPFVGDQVFAALASGATALPFVVTARRIRGR